MVYFAQMAGRLAAVAIAAYANLAVAHTPGYVATSAKPVTIPLIVTMPSRTALAGGRFVDIAVRGFHPSAAGPVQIVVEAKTRTSHVEIGRFGIYPERPISANEAERQRFSLPVPRGLRLTRASRLVVRIVPGRGTAEGAEVEVESARLR